MRQSCFVGFHCPYSIELKPRHPSLSLLPSRPQQGLAAAIRLKQRANANGTELSVCVVEKGAEVGAHILSGMYTSLSSSSHGRNGGRALLLASVYACAVP